MTVWGEGEIEREEGGYAPWVLTTVYSGTVVITVMLV